jgi:hypothetical protein
VTYQFPRNQASRNSANFHVGKTEVRIQQDKMKKIITDPPELYWYHAANVVEVMNLLFVSVNGVWATSRFID